MFLMVTFKNFFSFPLILPSTLNPVTSKFALSARLTAIEPVKEVAIVGSRCNWKEKM